MHASTHTVTLELTYTDVLFLTNLRGRCARNILCKELFPVRPKCMQPYDAAWLRYVLEFI